VSVAAPRYDTHPAPAAHTRHRNGYQDQAEPSGYTLEEIDKLARTAIAGKLIPGIDASDAYESAWFAIVATLYTHTTSEPPWPGRLVWDARQALQRLVETERHHHGLVQRGGAFGRNFERYWDWHARLTTSPEEVVVDQLALQQVWPLLTEREQHAVTALAALGSHRAAAAALGCTVAAFDNRMRRARGRLLALWHEHETPPPARPWRGNNQRGCAESWRRHDHAPADARAARRPAATAPAGQPPVPSRRRGKRTPWA